MNAWTLRIAVAGLLVLLGMAVGSWATMTRFRPLLEAEQNQVASCKSARDHLAGLAAEQGKKLGDLSLAAQTRQAGVEKAVAEATSSAQADYAAANRLLQERTGGEQCTASASIIDTELDL